MNDTILNSRQKRILALLKEKGQLSRADITGLLKGGDKKVSGITVIRDLNLLVASGFVRPEGQARATTYALAQANPLLQYIDMDAYFDLAMDAREAQQVFQRDALGKLVNLYDEKEIKEWDDSAVAFGKRKKELDPTIYKRELERFIIELSWKSSQIEGNTYDLLETEALIEQHIEARGHPKEEAAMILNHKAAFDTIIQKREKFQKLTLPLVTQLHNVLVSNMDISTGLRDQPVRVVGTAYVPPRGREVIGELLREVIDHINAVSYPPEKALIASCMIAYLQPFADGNKRTARMLANALLLAYGYFPLSYRNVDVTAYRRAMILFYEQNNLYHLKRLFLEQLNFAVSNYFLV